MKTAVFHKIGEPSEDHMVNSLEQILAFDGQITFDGAYMSVYEHRKQLAFLESPLLFIQGYSVGTEGIMSWQQIMELVFDNNFQLGWHGHSHRRLTELRDSEVEEELTCPLPLDLYAYPHGDWDSRVAKIVQEMGYLRAYSTTQGEEGNDFAIPRIYL